MLAKKQLDYLNDVEMPLMQELYKMEERGVHLNTSYLKQLDVRFASEMEDLEKQFPAGLNPRSPQQVQAILSEAGIDLDSTGVAFLKEHKGNPLVDTLIKYREVSKLRSTYTQSLLALDSKTVHTRFNQSRTVTGRLSSSDPNLQNIPTRTEVGDLLRKAFVPAKNKALVVADYSQIEYRLFAHYSQEPVLLEAFKNGKDVHEETANSFGTTRHIGKTLNFAAIYGAQGPKIAATSGLSEGEAESALTAYWRALPKAATWLTKAKWEARQAGGITTLLGRYIPLPGLRSNNRWERAANERYAISYTIQGSAAEIIKLAMIQLGRTEWVHNYEMLLSVHDEIVMQTSPKNVEKVIQHVKDTMTSVVSLTVPLEITIGHGQNWQEAKQ